MQGLREVRRRKQSCFEVVHCPGAVEVEVRYLAEAVILLAQVWAVRFLPLAGVLVLLHEVEVEVVVGEWS